MRISTRAARSLRFGIKAAQEHSKLIDIGLQLGKSVKELEYHAKPVLTALNKDSVALKAYGRTMENIGMKFLMGELKRHTATPIVRDGHHA